MARTARIARAREDFGDPADTLPVVRKLNFQGERVAAFVTRWLLNRNELHIATRYRALEVVVPERFALPKHGNRPCMLLLHQGTIKVLSVPEGLSSEFFPNLPFGYGDTKVVGKAGFTPTTQVGYMFYRHAPARFGISPESVSGGIFG